MHIRPFFCQESKTHIGAHSSILSLMSSEVTKIIQSNAIFRYSGDKWLKESTQLFLLLVCPISEFQKYRDVRKHSDKSFMLVIQ